MKDLLTPRQVARAIHVSESSVKRWCDKGVIPAKYTPGGHRRIEISAFLAFIRASNYELVDPGVVGLPATSGRTCWVIQRAAENLTEVLVQGDDEKCRGILLDLFLAEHGIAKICDEVFAPAFEEIGNRWESGDAEVFQERRACQIALRALHEFRSFIPSPPPAGTAGVGRSPGGRPLQSGHHDG